jgi:hypothetical protein
LKDYAGVFQEPLSLPPVREVEHCITLKKGTEPINVYSYWYAYFKKEEIEKKVQKMLNSSLIWPGTSLFLSSILLVKKKDRSWWFGTNYLTLNTATIKDRFLSPIIDDMLDELHGASFFTKLNLKVRYH